ncbi:MAG: HAMP domain-containing protein [Myxococcales bacterium]|nr:HAMP domain-containing protein [Myxococcales bacterium]
MAVVRDTSDVRLSPAEAGEATVVPFKRHLFIVGVVMAAAELALVGYPLWAMFDLGRLGSSTIIRIGVPTAVGAALAWLAIMTAWLVPIRACVVAHRRGERASKSLAARGYRACVNTPVRVLIGRTTLWIVIAGSIGVFLVRYQDWPQPRALAMASLAGLHAAPLAAIRAAWLDRVLRGVRARVFVITPPVRIFADEHFRQLLLVSIGAAAGALIMQSAFLYYFVPISFEHYLGIETYLPGAAALGWAAWAAIAHWQTRPLVRYLAAASGDGGDASEVGNATSVYRLAQALPYRLAAASLTIWIVIALVVGLIARRSLAVELDDTIVGMVALLVVALTAAIYETLGHRDTLRPLLAHLSTRYRIPVRAVATPLSLGSKMLLSFGGVVVLACGMALLWGFVQYKNLATDAVGRQARLGLYWVRSEVQAVAAVGTEPPTPELVAATLRDITARNPEASAVVYYLDDSTQPAGLVAVGGGPMGAPALPWYVAGTIASAQSTWVTIGPASLAGLGARLTVRWHDRDFDLGAVAVLYPTYRGRGESMVRPLQELLVFFLVLFAACAGIVLVTVSQFVTPIRRLEQRADAMARGELADPVTANGDGDEVGRLTFALEEMRRALRDKLRSTEEVNLDLERAVQRRTHDLAKKNKELAETLDKLTRTQAQLVRAEKMASIGQLVAGIAHEINNPVNAIVNTVGPLEEALGDFASDPAHQEAADDVRDMVRVIQRGAQRTKAIVTALHNYSRTDDETVVDFDLNRSLDDSLELLRHLLKGNVTVVKHYGEVGKIRGHAGQLGQVFMNLFTNAIQAMAGRDDAALTISTRTIGDQVEVKVGDNGPGIPAEVVPRIFDPFFTTKDVGEGTGLGLSIVHELVARHSGTIEVDTQIGAGTEFTVTLPRDQDHRPPRVTAAGLGPAPRS